MLKMIVNDIICLKYMNKIIFILMIVSIYLVVSGCKKGNTETDKYETIQVDITKNNNSLDTIFCFDSTKTHKLQLPDSDVIGIINKVIFDKEYIYLLSKKQKEIFVFTKNGIFTGKIDSAGSGPGEYTSIDNFFLQDELIGIVDVNLSTILFYNIDGQFIDKIFYTDILRDVIAFSKDTYLCYTPDLMKNNEYGIWLMNNEGNKVKSLFKPKVKTKHSISAPWFNIVEKSDNNFAVYLTNQNKIAYVNNEGTEVKYKFKVKNGKTLSDFNDAVDKIYIKDEYYETIHIMDTDHWVYSTWANTKTYEMTRSLYHKGSKRSFSFKEFNFDSNVREYAYPVFSNKTNSLIYMIHGDESTDSYNSLDYNTLYLLEFIFNSQPVFDI